MTQAWSTPIPLHQLARGPVQARLEPDAKQRAAIARTLGLESLPSLTADLTVRPWLDGAEVTGRFQATVEQLCSVTLDPFEQPLAGEIAVRAVPRSSPNAPADAPGEVELDPDAPDPPDLLDGDRVDLAAMVVEHLALAIDPFPRKPGVEFEYTPPDAPDSPFAVQRKLNEPTEPKA